MAQRRTVSTGTVWEKRAGYCRALRVGDQVFVSGTTATDPHGNVVGPDDAAAQARYILKLISSALQELDSSIADVVRYRCYITNVDDWMAVGDVLGEFFGDVRPVSTLYEVSRLVGDEYLVEIEVDAIAGSGSNG
jgi:enamine deaminase RidA (YjgF/YER057c/UK114 family)